MIFGIRDLSEITLGCNGGVGVVLDTPATPQSVLGSYFGNTSTIETRRSAVDAPRPGYIYYIINYSKSCFAIAAPDLRITIFIYIYTEMYIRDRNQSPLSKPVYTESVAKTCIYTFPNWWTKKI